LAGNVNGLDAIKDRFDDMKINNIKDYADYVGVEKEEVI
jgi:hypothetical protein